MADSTRPRKRHKTSRKMLAGETVEQRKARIKKQVARNRRRREQETEEDRAKRLEYHRSYYLANRERLLASCKEYRKRNHKKKKANDRLYYNEHRESISAYSKSPAGRASQKKYRDKVAADPDKKARKRELDRLYSKQYRLRHPSRHKESQKRYRINNKDTIRRSELDRIAKDPIKHRKEATRRVRESRARFFAKHGAHSTTIRAKKDALFRLIVCARSRVAQALKRDGSPKSQRTIHLIGCTAEQLKLHIESQFAKGMSWENRHEWHIDHIIPVSKFDLSDPEQQAAAFHYTNLQPLWAADNLRKSAKVQGQNLFGFAYAARIADVESATSTRRRRDGRKHGGDRH
jgi:hypothetical protein